MKNARKKAVERSWAFYGMKPRHKTKVLIEMGRRRVLMLIGQCMQLNYKCDKFDGKVREYYHRFGPGCQIYALDSPQPDGSEILIIKGPFKIKPAGLTG